MYRAELGRRSRRFDRGVGVERLPVPVISVGNLSVGGTGKTPMVRRVCAWLSDAGARPCVAMRGYKSAGGGSDEEREYAQTLPGVPVVAQPDRAAGVRALLETPGGASIGAVILDDGFQHRRLARDLDIVLLDATRDPFVDRALPAGWLRELPDALVRAHAVVVTHAERATPERAEAMLSRARAINGALVCAVASHVWTGLTIVDDSGGAKLTGLDWLRARPVVAACAIGNPDAFIARAAEAIGAAPVACVVLRDHAAYDDRQVREIAAAVRSAGAQAVLTTHKDLVKLRARAPALGVPVAAADLGLVFARGEADLRRLVLAAAGG